MHRVLTRMAWLGAMLLAAPLGAQAPVAAPLAAPAPAAAPTAPAAVNPGLAKLTAEDATAWLDGLMPYALHRAGVAGAVVVIVKDGQVLLEKGYGVSDVATGAPVDPKKTLFRPGSVSKLFGWTAVMQLVEAGKIDLDADINKYLDFTIPPYQGKPLTMRQVMTHTTGFEESIKGLIVTDPKNLPTLEHELKRFVPTRVFPPGEIPAYSNYGAALAGYVVQRVSGQSFDEYIETHIFKPLGMADSSFRQPLQPRLAAQMSKGYESADGKPKDYELVPMAPAGSLAATGDDMGKFMIAHLAHGGVLLKPETSAQMFATNQALLAPLDGMALGFFEEKINGERGVGHGGDTGVFHSHLHLFPDANVGLFVSFNSAGREGGVSPVRDQVYEGFADRYLPGTRTMPGTVDKATAAEHAKLMASTQYISARGAFSSFMSLLGLFSQAQIIVNDDGTISMSGLNDFSRVPKHFREVAPFVWKNEHGHDYLGAKVVDGKVKLLSDSDFSGAITWIPAEPLKSSALLFPWLGFGLFVLLGSLIAWLFAALARRHYAASFPLSGVRATGYRLTRLFALVGVVAMAGWVYLASKASSGLEGLGAIGKMDGFIIVLEALGIVGFVGGTLVALWNAWVVWTKGGGWFAKLWSLALVIAFAGFAWTFYAYNLMNFSTNY